MWVSIFIFGLEEILVSASKFWNISSSSDCGNAISSKLLFGMSVRVSSKSTATASIF